MHPLVQTAFFLMPHLFVAWVLCVCEEALIQKAVTVSAPDANYWKSATMRQEKKT